MPQISVGSSNISLFGFSAVLDIANRTLTFDISQLTTGSGLANTRVSFAVETQGGITLSAIDFNSPSNYIVPTSATTWVLDLSGNSLIFLFQNYKIYGSIQDNGGAVYSTTPVYKDVCQPVDIGEDSTVPGIFEVSANCPDNILLVKELTLLIYNNSKPTSVTKSGILSYPTGTISPVAFTGTPFTNNIVYTGEYRIVCTTIARYSLGDDIYIDISYYTNSVFPVTCANKMGDLMCCITDIQNTYLKNCENAKGAAAKQQLAEIAIPFMLGINAEMNGMDASDQYNLIKKQLNCNCGATSIRQNEFTPINPAVTSIVLVGSGGTTIGAPVTNGNTKTYTVVSKIYQVTKGNTGDLAFSITVDNSVPGTVSYQITFDYNVMAGYILTAIANNPTLINQLNALINSTGVNLTGLNGYCIIDMTQADYTLSLTVNNNTLITNIVINGTNYAAPANLFANNAAAVLAWLTSLTLGSFSVVVNGSNVLTIFSAGNTNVLSTATFTTPDTTLMFQSTNKTLVQVLQAIIDYLCALTTFHVELNDNLQLCLFDYSGLPYSVNYTPTQTQGLFNQGLASAICNLAGRINTLTGVTCDQLRAIFIDRPGGSFGNAGRFYGTLDGSACAGMTDQQAALAILNAINKYTDVKTLYCSLSCTTPATCPDVAGTSLGIVNSTTIGFYGLNWTVTPSAAQTVTLRYRLQGSSTWITASSGIVIAPNGLIIGTTPFQIPGLTMGDVYEVWAQNNCGGTGFIQPFTLPSAVLYTGSYLLDSNIYAICGDTPVTLYSGVPFGVGVTLYINSSLTTPVTGYTLVSPLSGGHIYNLNTSTGVVGADTGLICGSGTAGLYRLANAIGSVCAASAGTLYTSGVFTVGGTLYTDSSLSTPQTGFSYVLNVATGHIYNLNTVNGVIGSDTGTACSATTVQITSSMAGTQLTSVTGITGFTPTPPLPMSPGGNVTGTHSGFTGTIGLTITGTPLFAGNISLYVDTGGGQMLIQCINVSSAGTYTFASYTYASTDIIYFYLNLGGC